MHAGSVCPVVASWKLSPGTSFSKASFQKQGDAYPLNKCGIGWVLTYVEYWNLFKASKVESAKNVVQ